MPSTDRTARALAYLGLILTALFWAGNAVVGRGIGDAIPPVALSFWRWTIALVPLLPFAVRGLWSRRRTIADQWRLLLVLAALSVSAFNILFYLATRHTLATNIGLLNSTMPIMVLLLAWFMLGVRPAPRRLIGIGCGFMGLLIIVSEGQPQRLLDLSLRSGDLFMVGAVLLWSWFTVLLKRYPVDLPALEFLTLQILLGVLLLLPLYLVEYALVGGFAAEPALVPALLYVALFPGLLAYGLWNMAVSRLGPQSAAAAAYLVPLFAALLAWQFLDEVPGFYHLTGGVLILAGVYLAGESGSRPRAGDAVTVQKGQEPPT